MSGFLRDRNPPMGRNHKAHFHIGWSTGKLDWERFSTREEAEASAKRLARTGESYEIKEFDITCPTCLKVYKVNFSK